MPKVEIERLAERVPTTTGQPRASVEGINLSQSLSRELQQAGSQLQGFGLETARKIKTARDNEYVSSAMVDSSEQIHRFEKEFQKNSAENPAGYSDAYIQELDSIHEEFVGAAPSQEAKNQLNQIFASQRIGKFKSALAFEEKATANKVINSAEENLNLITNRLQEDPSLLVESQEEIDTMISSIRESLDSKTADKFEEFASKTLTRSVVTGLSNTKDFEGARSFLENENVQKILSPQEVDRLNTGVDNDEQSHANELKKQASAEYNQFIDEAKKSIVQGGTTEIDLNNLLEQGAFRDTDDYLSLRRILKAQRKGEDIKTNAINSVDAAINAGVPLNAGSKTDRKKADVYYNEVIVPTTAPEDLAGRTHSFIMEVGAVPEGIKTNLVNTLYGGSPEQSLGSATTIDRLIQSEPKLARSFKDKDLAVARRMSNGLQAGLTPEEVVKVEQERVRLSPQMVDVREAALAGASPQFDPDEITSFFIDDPETIPEELIVDWENRVTTFAIDLGMEPEDAIDLSYKRSDATWHRSGITGDPRWMKKSPEIYYAIPGQNNDWMREQFENDMSSFEGLEDVQIRVDPESNPNQPEYLITHKLQGFEVPLVDNEGSILTWNPDWSIYSGKILEEVREERQEFLTEEQKTQGIQSIREGF